jgi:hypothetical protein
MRLDDLHPKCDRDQDEAEQGGGGRAGDAEEVVPRLGIERSHGEIVGRRGTSPTPW